MTEELKPCPLTWAIQRLNSTPYSLTKDECVEVLRGLRDEIRALTQRPAAQAMPHDETHDWSDRIAKLQRPASLPTQPAAQATPEPLPLGPLAKRNIYDAIRGAYDLGYNDARNARTVPGDSAPGYDGRSVEEDHGSALFNILSKRLKPATPEPVGEVVYQLQSGDGKWIDQTRASYDYNVKHGNAVRVLHTRPAPGVPDFASLLKIKEPDGCAENIEQADRQEARCNGWNDCRDEVLNILAAAQAKGGQA